MANWRQHKTPKKREPRAEVLEQARLMANAFGEERLVAMREAQKRTLLQCASSLHVMKVALQFARGERK